MRTIPPWGDVQVQPWVDALVLPERRACAGTDGRGRGWGFLLIPGPSGFRSQDRLLQIPRPAGGSCPLRKRLRGPWRTGWGGRAGASRCSGGWRTADCAARTEPGFVGGSGWSVRGSRFGPWEARRCLCWHWCLQPPGPLSTGLSCPSCACSLLCPSQDSLYWKWSRPSFLCSACPGHDPHTWSCKGTRVQVLGCWSRRRAHHDAPAPVRCQCKFYLL